MMKISFPKTDRNAPCWCGSGKKYKQCHMRFEDRLRAAQAKGYEVPARKLIKTPLDVEGIRASARINMAALDAVADQIRIGMSTEEINQIVHEITEKAGAVPAPLHYEGFPKSVCTSLNDEVCHGIPSEEIVLKDGDIINVDVSTVYNGYYSDSSRMFLLGDVSEEKRRLVRVAK